MLNRENLESLLNRSGNVIGSDGEKIGSIGQLYADDDTGEPTWITVKTGLFGTSQSFVPVEGAHIQGDDLVVPHSRDRIKDAPRVDVDGHLTPEEEDQLYTYYERGARTYSEAREEVNPQEDIDLQGDADLNAGTPYAGSDGYASDARGDTATASTDSAAAQTESPTAGRNRLRKYQSR